MRRSPTCFFAATAMAMGLHLAYAPAAIAEPGDGVVKVESRYPMAETIDRIKLDIEAKGIQFFSQIDQKRLAADAGISLQPSTLLVFGNPALGAHFITADAEAGLDWPVRLLVTQDDSGKVWAVYTDFSYIAKRHGIVNRNKEFGIANAVIGSITSTVSK